MDDYRAVLAKVDAWYRDVQARFPDKVPCRRGCRDCCLGLFDVTLADRDLLREGLAAADPAVRADIEARATAVLERLRAVYPDLGENLDGWSPDDIDDLCDAVGDVECPVLGPDGACRLYAHRPMTCRMAGVPVVDTTGLTIAPEGCAKCTLRPEETPRLDAEGLRREERRVLRRLHPGKSGTAVLIPQALSPES